MVAPARVRVAGGAQLVLLGPVALPGRRDEPAGAVLLVQAVDVLEVVGVLARRATPGRVRDEAAPCPVVHAGVAGRRARGDEALRRPGREGGGRDGVPARVKDAADAAQRTGARRGAVDADHG